MKLRRRELLALPLATAARAGGTTMRVTTDYYQEFDADYTREVPAEGYGGWRQTVLELDPSKLAVVCMHAWDLGSLAEAPGHWRSVEYVPRSYAIAAQVFPPLFAAVRRSPVRLWHVVGGGVDYYSHLPGYQLARSLASPEPPAPERVPSDPVLQRLQQFRADQVWRGAANNAAASSERQRLDFLPAARPQGDEGVAENTAQLFALCRHYGVNHLLYCGFALDACLLLSPGGMHEISRHGVLCSAIREATLAVESKETARTEGAKAVALWRVAVSYGFVFGAAALQAALEGTA
ncbi:MAG: hypothetical protein IT204_19890 [Fimbriimonadaceae bacterium]|nr:hypothetical protein [Fimbriimonadaceae bacterium]